MVNRILPGVDTTGYMMSPHAGLGCVGSDLFPGVDTTGCMISPRAGLGYLRSIAFSPALTRRAI